MTAVEWLFEQLTEVDYKCINKTFLQNNNSLAGCKLRELFEQAKEMEKEQLKEAQVAFKCDSMGFKTLLENQFENWYKEKYKK